MKITGKKATSAIDIPPSQKLRPNLIQMDGLIRTNAGTGIGDQVKIEKISVETAKKVILAPVEEGITITSGSAVIRNNLIDRPLVKGDILSVMGRGRSTVPFQAMFFGGSKPGPSPFGEI